MKVRVRATSNLKGWFVEGEIYEGTPVGNYDMAVKTKQGNMELFYNPYRHPSSCFETVADSPDDKFREVLLNESYML